MSTPQLERRPPLSGNDRRFYLALALLGGLYVVLLMAMLVADAAYTTPTHLWAALGSPEIRYAIRLTLISSTISMILSLWVAVPLGYLLSRTRFRFRGMVDLIVEIPIVLPPLVVGLSLLILFQTGAGRFFQQFLPVTYAIPGVILAQFVVACAFATRTMRTTFDQLDPRPEQVALTLGCHRGQEAV